MNIRKRYTYLEDKDIELILKLRKEGKTYRVIAGFFNVDPTTVKRYCIVMKMGWTADQISFVRKKYKAGWTIGQIADHFGCDRRRVGAVMRINGIRTTGKVVKKAVKTMEPKESFDHERRRVEIIMASKKYSF